MSPELERGEGGGADEGPGRSSSRIPLARTWRGTLVTSLVSLSTFRRSRSTGERWCGAESRGRVWLTELVVVQRLCGSGFQAVINAAHEIKLGEAHVVLTGGAENMSLAPCSSFPPPPPSLPKLTLRAQTPSLALPASETATVSTSSSRIRSPQLLPTAFLSLRQWESRLRI